MPATSVSPSTQVAIERSSTCGAWTIIGPCAAGAIATVDFAVPGQSSVAKNEAPRYVVKTLRPVWRNDPLVLSQFRNEAELGRRLTHANLVPVLDAGLESATPYLVMPYIRGRTIAELIRDDRRPPLPQVWGIARQVATALTELHRHGILHGDVKPANILLAEDGHATLLDLGSARAISETAAVWDRAILGSPGYLAPEQFTSTLRIDERSDLFSLGVVLFELLTGVPYRSFHNGCAPSTPLDIQNLRRVVPTVSNEQSEFLRRLIATAPERRPETAQEVVASLARFEVAAWAQWWTRGEERVA